MGSDLPYREFGYASAADFLRDGCGNAFGVTQSETDKSVFYVAPKNSLSDGTRLTLKREVPEKLTPESERMRKALQTLNNGNVTSPKAKKSVPPQFKQYLRFLISRHSTGITAEGLVAEFLRVSGSSLRYEMYGYADYLEMFRDLEDVFTIRESEGSYILYPAAAVEKSAFTAEETSDENCHPNVDLETVPKNGLSEAAVEKSPPKAAVVKLPHTLDGCRFPEVGRIDLESGGSLVHVKLNGHWYIPTACVASLAGLQSDCILEVLHDQHIEIQGVEILSESVREHMKLRYEIALVNCPLIITKAGALVQVSRWDFDSCSTLDMVLKGSRAVRQNRRESASYIFTMLLYDEKKCY